MLEVGSPLGPGVGPTVGSALVPDVGVVLDPEEGPIVGAVLGWDDGMAVCAAAADGDETGGNVNPGAVLVQAPSIKADAPRTTIVRRLRGKRYTETSLFCTED